MSVRAPHAPHDIQSHALFGRRVRRHKVAGDAMRESRTIRLLMSFLPRWRVWSSDVGGRVGGRLKPVTPFLSLLRVQLQKSPPSCNMFHFGPSISNFISFPDFWYISFDFIQLGPPIGMESVVMFQFGPYSFNFRIYLKKMNLFSTVVSISSFLPFD